MDKLKMAERLISKTNISYEEAKEALENNNWDILDATIYLENCGRVNKPKIDIFYTNEFYHNYEAKEECINQFNQSEESNNKSQSNGTFEGIFEKICRIIDTGNNIFLEISKDNAVFLNIPITVVVILIVFGFVFIIPIMIIGLFFNMQYRITSKRINTSKANEIIEKFEKAVYLLKEKVKGGD